MNVLINCLLSSNPINDFENLLNTSSYLHTVLGIQIAIVIVYFF